MCYNFSFQDIKTEIMTGIEEGGGEEEDSDDNNDDDNNGDEEEGDVKSEMCPNEFVATICQAEVCGFLY